MAIVLFAVYLLGMVAEFRITEAYDQACERTCPLWVNVSIGIAWPLLIVVVLVFAAVFPDRILRWLFGEDATNKKD